MKKQLFLLLLTAFVTLGALAQENGMRIGINVGPQWNDKLGCMAGVDALIPFGQSRWGFEPGLYWSFRHAASEHSENSTKEEYDDKMHYLDVPLRLAVRVAGREDGPFNMSILFGPYLAYGLGGTSHCTITKDGQVTRGETGAFSDAGRLKSRLDYGLNIGLNAVIRQHVKVGAFTEIGLKDIYRQNSIAEELIGDIFGVTKINLGAGFSVGYQF